MDLSRLFRSERAFRVRLNQLPGGPVADEREDPVQHRSRRIEMPQNQIGRSQHGVPFDIHGRNQRKIEPLLFQLGNEFRIDIDVSTPPGKQRLPVVDELVRMFVIPLRHVLEILLDPGIAVAVRRHEKFESGAKTFCRFKNTVGIFNIAGIQKRAVLLCFLPFAAVEGKSVDSVLLRELDLPLVTADRIPEAGHIMGENRFGLRAERKSRRGKRHGKCGTQMLHFCSSLLSLMFRFRNFTSAPFSWQLPMK